MTPPATTAQTRKTILIAEDEPLVLALAVAEFEDAGFRVLSASDGRSALETLERNADIALLFTDIRMPGQFDGWALARAARQLRPEIAVVYTDLVEGGVLFIKPYRLSQVVATAESLLSAS